MAHLSRRPLLLLALALSVVSLACGGPGSVADAGLAMSLGPDALPGAAADGPPGACVRGPVSTNTTWPARGSLVSVCGTVTVESGATLTIAPGATVELDPEVSINVANGGRLLAEGTEAKTISFTRPAKSTASWGNITINGGAGSPETRISHAHFDFNASALGATAVPCLQVTGGTVHFDHLTFGNTGSPYIHLDGASFVVSDCTFPTPTAVFEPVHGTQGVKSGGHGIVSRCFFGAPTGYNDAVDFTGGNRPGDPIVHFINNVFVGSEDDILDLDGTDAWVEGNIFMHAHKGRATPDSASAVSGGGDSGNTSEITIIGNVIYDCDQAAAAKEGNFFTLINNTIVRQNHAAGDDTDGAVVLLAEGKTSEAAGMYLEGNILFDIEKLTRNAKAAVVTFTNNLMPLRWDGPGTANTTGDPIFKHVPQPTETVFMNWAQAQVMRTWLGLDAASPGRGTGPNGIDKGGGIPPGVSISGEPDGVTKQTTATLVVGPNRMGNSIPLPGWPNGSGYTHYKWRLDGGVWSPETPIGSPVALKGLVAGPHQVEVTGKRDSGLYQDDPLFGADAVLSRSRTWTVTP